MIGKIVTRPLTALNNKLCIEYHWFEKDHTDSNHFTEDYEILKRQWVEIIERNLVGQEIEFEKIDDADFKENIILAKIIFPTFNYTEKEVEHLVRDAWREGWYANSYSPKKDILKGSEQFWKTNKKK